jgi:hypothetical protein
MAASSSTKWSPDDAIRLRHPYCMVRIEEPFEGDADPTELNRGTAVALDEAAINVALDRDESEAA